MLLKLTKIKRKSNKNKDKYILTRLLKSQPCANAKKHRLGKSWGNV